MKKQRKRGGKSRKSRAGKNRKSRPPRVQFEFTDLDLTAFGGASVLAQTAQQFGLFELLDGAVSGEGAQPGASDMEMLWAMIASLARGHGSLSHLDALRADRAAGILLVPGRVPAAHGGMAVAAGDGGREGSVERGRGIRPPGGAVHHRP